MTSPDVQAELDLRTDIKTNGVAIVERGSTRHYYKKLAHGWKHISTSTDASPSFDHEQTAEQREEALKQTAKVEEAMKKWFAAQATATTIDPNRPCPANKGGQHSFNDTVVARGKKYGVCTCGAEHVIGDAPNSGQIPEFDYRREPGVFLEVEQEIQRDPIIYGRVQMRSRRTFVNLQIPRSIAVRDGWDFVKFNQFKLMFDAGSTPVRVLLTILTVYSNFAGDTQVKAEVLG